MELVTFFLKTAPPLRIIEKVNHISSNEKEKCLFKRGFCFRHFDKGNDLKAKLKERAVQRAQVPGNRRGRRPTSVNLLYASGIQPGVHLRGYVKLKTKSIISR
jgi:hypothetical protein